MNILKLNALIFLLTICSVEQMYAQTTTPNDEHFERQWYLHNTGEPYLDGNGKPILDENKTPIKGTKDIDINAPEAWEISKGDGIRVAIYDDGIRSTHPDLLVNEGFNVRNPTEPVPLEGDDNHGTPCAGIVGATGNGKGIIGVAPQSILYPISFPGVFGNKVCATKIASGFEWAVDNEIDVISCSWNGKETMEVTNAINKALKYGRKGLGTVVVFSSDNEGSTSKFPSNSIEDLLVVGAIDRNGKRWIGRGGFSSGYGEHLDVVAGGEEIYTTLQDKSYGNFFHTSAAVPQVAGVAALILSVNPYLTASEVNDIIEKTARKIREGDGVDDCHTGLDEDCTYKYVDGLANHPNGSWNKYVGYGLVDAHEAVKEAKRLWDMYECKTDEQIPSNIDNNNITNSLNTKYFSSESITTEADKSNNNPDVIIQKDETVFMFSNHITLKEGFKVDAGGCLNAIIEPCK